MTKIGLLGLGRIGREIWKHSKAEPQKYEVVVAIDKDLEASKDIEIPVYKPQDINSAITQHSPQVLIDFSHPSATLENIPVVLQNKISIVVCTTGFTEDQQQFLKDVANNSKGALLYAPNITLGINLLMLFSKIAGRILDDYDIQITDYHFKGKKDNPSGTALKLAKELEEMGVKPHVHGVRAGGIIGKHKVLFAGGDDQLEIIHESYTPTIFAKNALKMASLLVGKQGYFEVMDLLELKFLP